MSRPDTNRDTYVNNERTEFANGDMSDDDDENEIIMLAALLIVTSRKTGLPLDRYRVFSGNSFTPFCCAK